MKGKIQEWNDTKGYGFIRSLGSESKTFFHISDVKTKGRRPIIGDIVDYSVTKGRNGRDRATVIYIAGLSTYNINHSKRRSIKSMCSDRGHYSNVIAALIIIIFLGALITNGSGFIPSLFKNYQQVQIVSINKAPHSFDGKSISISGFTYNYQEKISRKGNSYTVFWLYNNSEYLSVHYKGHLGLSENLTVTVKGTFLQEKRLGDLVFYNQLEADVVDKI